MFRLRSRCSNDTLSDSISVARGDGNAEEMPVKRTALTLLALLGSVALGNGEFRGEHLSGFCLPSVFFLDRASPVVAHRHGAPYQGFG